MFWNGQVKSNKAADSPSKGSIFATPEAVFVNLAVIVATAATGLVVANILRKQDNLVKLIGTSLSIVTIIVGQWIFFPVLRAKTFNVQTVAGAGIIAISVWTYHYYKQAQPRTSSSHVDYSDEMDSESSIPLKAEDDESPSSKAGVCAASAARTNTNTKTLTPTLPRVAVAILVVLGLSIGTAFSEQRHRVPNGTPQGTFQATVDPYGRRDIERFFVPHNVTPAVWGETTRGVGCINKWIKREKVLPYTQKFNDWEYSFLDSGCPVYPIPDGGLIFHQYWHGEWRDFQEITIEAFLATQRLGDGHRLIYWYEEGGPNDAVRKRFTEGEYAKYVEFRELDRATEAKGTCLESMPEWTDVEYRKALKMKKSTSSDIVRNMLLAKYGGVWLDSDTIPLVDFTGMIRSGPSVPGVCLAFSRRLPGLLRLTDVSHSSVATPTTMTSSSSDRPSPTGLVKGSSRRRAQYRTTKRCSSKNLATKRCPCSGTGSTTTVCSRCANTSPSIAVSPRSPLIIPTATCGRSRDRRS